LEAGAGFAFLTPADYLAAMHNIVRLRALAPAKGFAFEPSIFRDRVRLIQLDFGHRVKNFATGTAASTVHEACVYLRSLAAASK
jgi:hypothetical protein